jgi:Fe-only nitrogenase accessory protein AnfO
MKHTIAAILNDMGTTSDFSEGKQFKIFAVDGEDWSIAGSLQFSIENQASMGKVRRELIDLERTLSEILDHDSKVIVGSDISGLPYNIFDAAGYTIFEIEGEPEQFILRLGAQLETQLLKIDEGETIIYTDRPIEIGEGKYHIDLKTLQVKKPGITSKQALMPFFSSIPFLSLEIICAHIPPWFDREFGRLNLKYRSKKLDGSLRVIVTHKVCGEDAVSCES